ncbi:MAG TPA: GNAT family protein [Candidatus Bathyarchaeia archaeon]|nr:GNAT family protein [Candidatus Bathyarchaeia archaeon]
MGCLGLYGLSKANRRASIGYWLDSNYQGKGIMTASVKALIDYSFQELNLNRIGIEIATKNTRSLAITKRLNFVKEGVVREFEFVNNRFLSNIVYSFLKREWKS